MPKPIRWQDEPATEAQITKLYMMLRDACVMEVQWPDKLEDGEFEAVEWVNDNVILPREITHLNELTKGQIQKCFKELE